MKTSYSFNSTLESSKQEVVTFLLSFVKLQINRQVAFQVDYNSLEYINDLPTCLQKWYNIMKAT